MLIYAEHELFLLSNISVTTLLFYSFLCVYAFVTCITLRQQHQNKAIWVTVCPVSICLHVKLCQPVCLSVLPVPTLCKLSVQPVCLTSSIYTYSPGCHVLITQSVYIPCPDVQSLLNCHMVHMVYSVSHCQPSLWLSLILLVSFASYPFSPKCLLTWVTFLSEHFHQPAWQPHPKLQARQQLSNPVLPH